MYRHKRPNVSLILCIYESTLSHRQICIHAPAATRGCSPSTPGGKLFVHNQNNKQMALCLAHHFGVTQPKHPPLWRRHIYREREREMRRQGKSKVKATAARWLSDAQVNTHKWTFSAFSPLWSFQQNNEISVCTEKKRYTGKQAQMPNEQVYLGRMPDSNSAFI